MAGRIGYGLFPAVAILWAKDQARRDKARVPQTIAFQTKPEIAFEQLKAARAAQQPKREEITYHAVMGW